MSGTPDMPVTHGTIEPFNLDMNDIMNDVDSFMLNIQLQPEEESANDDLNDDLEQIVKATDSIDDLFAVLDVEFDAPNHDSVVNSVFDIMEETSDLSQIPYPASPKKSRTDVKRKHVSIDQQHVPQHKRVALARNKQKVSNVSSNVRKELSLSCTIRKCLYNLEAARNLSTVIDNKNMFNFVSQTIKQMKYRFMQTFDYEIDNYCLPKLNSQCMVYDGLVGEKCTVVNRSTTVIEVQTADQKIKFVRNKNKWSAGTKVLSYKVEL